MKIFRHLGAALAIAVLCMVAAPISLAPTAAFAMSKSQAALKACDGGYAAFKAANPVPAGETAKVAYHAYLSACLKTPTPPPAPVPVDPTPAPSPSPDPVVTPPDPSPAPAPDPSPDPAPQRRLR